MPVIHGAVDDGVRLNSSISENGERLIPTRVLHGGVCTRTGNAYCSVFGAYTGFGGAKLAFIVFNFMVDCFSFFGIVEYDSF